jgi:glycosyltransferase involved in cell wall biosynthesis
MNIAHLLPHSAHFPLAKHNGRYEWALRLARLQVAAGHTVTIYAAPDSSDATSGLIWRSLPRSLNNKSLDNIALIKTAFQQPEHDIFHSHFDYLHYLVADMTPKPILFTQHWFPNETVADASIYNVRGNVYAVPVTDYMQRIDQQLGLRVAERIYHGIDLTLFHPTMNHDADRLIFVGRIAPHKGVREIVEIAIAAGEKLDIIGKVNTVDATYWEDILPLVDGKQIRYLGALPQADVAHALAEAKAFLFSSQTLEAFGQVTIEAQACGTPVIINDVGASRELVKDGLTGFVVSTRDEYLKAIAQLTMIDSAACRTFAEQFDVHVMADQYSALYRRLIAEADHTV